MRARDLAETYPVVTLEADALTAAQTMANERAPGLIVQGDDGLPYTVLPGSQVLNFLIPKYVQDQPGLARAYDEQASDALLHTLTKHTVRDMLPKPADADELPVVDPDATTMEVAAVMARMRCPLVAVVDDRTILGAITVTRLLSQLLSS